MDPSSLYSEFNEALQQEIDYIQHTGGDSKFILRNGQLVDNYGGKFIYEFITEVPIELDDDAPINIKYANESISGSIVNVNGLKVLVGLNEDIGSNIPEIVITANASFLLERLQDRINDVKSRELSFNTEMAMKTFGYQHSVVDRDYSLFMPRDESDFLSKEQKEAMAQSLGSDITFMWGPPGTGKTTTLSYLANELLLRDKSILLVSHTNVAIDNALVQIARILQKRNDEKYYGGFILRIGKSPDQDFFTDFPELSLDHWVVEKGKDLNEKLEQLEAKLERELEVVDGFNKTLGLLYSITDAKKKAETCESDIKKIEAAINNAKNNIDITESRISGINTKLEKAKSSSFISRFLTGLNPNKLEGLLSQLSLRLEREKSELIRLQHERQVHKTKSQSIEKDLGDLQNRLTQFSKSEQDVLEESAILTKVKEHEVLIEELRSEIESVRDAIEQLAHKIVGDARLIGTTITKGYLHEDIFHRTFDVVIVDEASMAPLPALFFNSGLSIEKVVIIGDFRQLPPIAMGDHDLIEKWLKRDIFEVFGITEKINRGEIENRLAILKEQRRMPEEIAELVNKRIYANTLVTKKKPPDAHKKEEQVINSPPFPERKIILCDTSEFNPWCTRSPVRRSPFNVYSALLSVHLAEQAIYAGVDQLAILTPYRAQNSLIHKLVADKASVDRNFEKITPASIHRFQGRESELIIFDLVEGPMREIKWLGGGFNSDAMRLVNVAVTRTRAKVIFIANLKYLKNKLRSESILRQVVGDVETDYPPINTQEFFPFIKIPLERIESIDLNDAIPQFCNQAFFYKAFQRDLCKAEDKVVIVSPFMTQNRISSFEAVFREIHQRGVRTFIITKPFKEQNLSQASGREIADYLSKFNIEIIPKPLSHEKLAVIDGKTIWHGSLNILSHKNTSELMVRFTTQTSRFADEALKLCGINVEKIIEENIIEKKIQELNRRGVGFCSEGHPLVIKRGSRGLFLSCSEFPRHREALAPTIDLIAEVFGEKYLYCDICGSHMEIRFNPKTKSRFLGCPKYPEHRFTRPL
jgi:superfamily I DNA and/or RNA helicase/ssDNA-binding Zn-finger/Zn-ribbon topoisomerase 1